MNAISDAVSLIRRYRWEVFVNAFVDIMQIAFQVIIFTTTSTYLWIFLLPHILSNALIFSFFTTSDDNARTPRASKIVYAAQIIEALTLLADTFLVLLIIYAIVECAAYGNKDFQTSLLFGANLCQGPRYDGGFVQAIELVFAIGSIFLQISQLMTLEKVAKIQSDKYKGGLTFVIISIALSMYTVSYLAYRMKYLLLSLDVFALVASSSAMLLQSVLPATKLTKKEHSLQILDIILYCVGWLTSLGIVIYVIVDKVSVCRTREDGST